MASKISKADPLTLDAFGRDVARRRTASGITDLPANSGKRRTKSKKALLEAIRQGGEKR